MKSSSSTKSTTSIVQKVLTTTKMIRKSNRKRSSIDPTEIKKTGVVINEQNDIPVQKKHWNDMLHLSIKRFQDNDPTLTEGAKRNRKEKYPYIVLMEYETSGRSICKSCGIKIQPKNTTIRATYMMECHKGYRNPCTVHYTDSNCFWYHREFTKLLLQDITIHPTILQNDPTFQSTLETKFRQMKEQEKVNAVNDNSEE